MNESDDTTQNGDLDELMRAARQLPQAIAPSRDLWPGIERTISAPAPKRSGGREWKRVFAQAAAVVLLVGGSSGTTWLALQDEPRPATDVEAGRLQFASVAGDFGGRYNLGPEFVDARNNLAAGLDEKIAALPPQTREAVAKNIIEIRAAISEINRALADEPDNALLQDLLLSAYREELTLMKKVDGIATTSAMRRTDI
jgi:hypothetical protein